MTEIPILNAPVYEHGYVTGRYLTAVADGPDDDHLMDFTPAKGKVIFTPETVIRRYEGPSPALVVQRPVECPINSQGYLTSPDGWRGVSLIVGIYSVRFEVQGAQVPGPKRIEVKETHTPDAPLDLVLSMPEVVPPGSVVVVDETTAQRAEAAAARAEAVVADIESEVRAVVLASPELKGAKGDPGDKGDPGAPGAVPTSSDYLIVGPGRPDQPATTGGTITGNEPVGAEYRSTDGAGEGLFDWMKRPTGWELAGGGSSTGGVYYDKAGKAVPYVYVASDTDPGKTKVIDGKTYEVWWVQTTPPDPMQSTPIGVTQNVANRSYTVPSDPVATYTVGGSLKAPGTYPIGTSAATTLTWTATAKSGYGFKAGAVTSGTLTWPVKTYASGDVLLSDDFNDRAEGSMLGGTTTNSYAGGEPLQWTTSVITPNQTIGTTPAPWQIVAGAMTSPTGVNTKAIASVIPPTTSARLGIEFTPRATSATTSTVARIKLWTNDGEVWITGGAAQWRPKAGASNQVVIGNISIAIGDRVQFVLDGLNSTLKNLTTGQTLGVPTDEAKRAAVAAITSGVTKIDFESETEYAAIDNLKVYIP